MRLLRWCACFLFFAMILSLAAEMHVFFNKDLPLIIYDRGEMVWHIGKTVMAMAFVFGVWKGYI